MQYYRPQGELNVGDCMPFYQDGLFRLFYLIDEGHHQALGGLGGHQWAQATSRDLVNWTHHPLAIPITDDREGSICTGSVLFHEGTYYGFYATRMRDWTQHLSLATSRDGLAFQKVAPNPFASPPAGYGPYDYRDPCAFYSPADERFHLLVTAMLEDFEIPGRGGCLAHLASEDLQTWEVREPFIIPGLRGAPECPDYFHWRGWYYLVFSNGGIARYRMSRSPFGPWLRPRVDTLDGPAARVMKTAAFMDDRRIGVAWIGSREDDRDDGGFQFGGNALFRELIQHDDGTLGTTFVPEMTLPVTPFSDLALTPLGSGVTIRDGAVRPTQGSRWGGHPLAEPVGRATVGAPTGVRRLELSAIAGLAALRIDDVPDRVHLQLHMARVAGAAAFGLRLRAGEHFDDSYDLHIVPQDATVQLNGQLLTHVDELSRPFDLDVVLHDDLIDVCIDGRRTLVDRCPERKGRSAYLYVLDGEIVAVSRRSSEFG